MASLLRCSSNAFCQDADMEISDDRSLGGDVTKVCACAITLEFGDSELSGEPKKNWIKKNGLLDGVQ